MTKKALPRKKDGIIIGCYIWCQGCRHVHFFPINLAYYNTFPNPEKITKKPVWIFNGDFERPTFTPSLRQYYNRPESHGERAGEEVTTCHNIVTDGKIQFCSDSQHDLKNQTLDLQEIPSDYSLPDDVER